MQSASAFRNQGVRSLQAVVSTGRSVVRALIANIRFDLLPQEPIHQRFNGKRQKRQAIFRVSYDVDVDFAVAGVGHANLGSLWRRSQ
jgi:hypothetical protein